MKMYFVSAESSMLYVTKLKVNGRAEKQESDFCNNKKMEDSDLSVCESKILRPEW